MISTEAPTQPARPALGPLTAPLIDIVVPVYNERATLERSIRRLHGFLEANMPFGWRIVVADNASTDGTSVIARGLAADLACTEVLILPAKGRGRALRAAWSASDADVLCYLDVDLSTDLRALLPLVAGIVSGHSDVAIGTRLAPGSRVVRGPKRELISRSYNALLHVVLRARFSDAQCGFKAISADAARALLPDIRDEAWFFDTELLTLAQRRGMRIHEVAVDWVDDSDSRVEIVSTAMADLRGVARLALASRVVRFALIGAISTIAYALLFVALRPGLGAPWARRRARADGGRQHPRQPAHHLRCQGVTGPAGATRRRRAGVPAGVVPDRRRAGAAELARPASGPLAGGGRARGGQRARHRRSLRRAAIVGVCPNAASGGYCGAVRYRSERPSG